MQGRIGSRIGLPLALGLIFAFVFAGVARADVLIPVPPCEADILPLSDAYNAESPNGTETRAVTPITVPSGVSWTINQLVASGQTETNGTPGVAELPAQMNVYIYTPEDLPPENMPTGQPLVQRLGVPASYSPDTDEFRSDDTLTTIDLSGNPIVLPTGTYWLSVQQPGAWLDFNGPQGSEDSPGVRPAGRRLRRERLRRAPQFSGALAQSLRGAHLRRDQLPPEEADVPDRARRPRPDHGLPALGPDDRRQGEDGRRQDHRPRHL